MLAFLVFSDWFNPGDKVVELASGQQFEATLQYETENSFDLRLKETALGHEASAFTTTGGTWPERWVCWLP